MWYRPVVSHTTVVEKIVQPSVREPTQGPSSKSLSEKTRGWYQTITMGECSSLRDISKISNPA